MKKIVLLSGILFALLSCTKNNAPEIIDIRFSPSTGTGGALFTFTVQTFDKDQDSLTYLWTCDKGVFTDGQTSSQAIWVAPIAVSNESYSISVSVSDGIESISGTTQIQIGKTETGSISGKVYYTGSTIPIPGVTLIIAEKSVTSDLDGTFLLTGIPEGKQIILARKEDYEGFYKEITIERNLNHQVLVSMVSQKYSTKIFGNVRGDYSGKPYSEATLVVLNPDSSESELSATTGSTGFYQILSVPQGRRTIVAKLSGEIVFSADLVLSNLEYSLDIGIPEPFEFIDPRDDNAYFAFKIGKQTWMVDNLKYLPVLNHPADNQWTSPKYYVWNNYFFNPVFTIDSAKNSDHYKTYGVLYNWVAANSACPDGWHLPSDEEWKVLERYLGMNEEELDYQKKWRYSGDVGLKLKSKDGWNDHGNGIDLVKFNAKPGCLISGNGDFYGQGQLTGFWTSTKTPGEAKYHFYYCREFANSINGIMHWISERANYVRCVKN